MHFHKVPGPRRIGGVSMIVMVLLSSIQARGAAMDHIDHHIDKSVWTQVADPNGALIIFGYRRGMDVCGKNLSAQAVLALESNEDAVFGTACDRRIVIVRDISTPDGRLDRSAVAAHEAFHSAVQYALLRPRLDLVGFPGYPEGRYLDLIEARSRVLMHAIRSGNQSAVCSALQQIRSLPEMVRDYFLYRSYWEWPAEHYMRHSVLAGLSWEEYLARRKAWSEGRGNPLYEVGVAALDQVEATRGRESWQKDYMGGEAPINMIAVVNGCEPVLNPSILVDIKAVDIFSE